MGVPGHTAHSSLVPDPGLSRRDLLRLGAVLGATAVAGSVWPGRPALAAPAGTGAAPAGVGQLEVPYKTVDGRTLLLHVWTPAGWTAGQAHPAVVFYHGGAWLRGQWSQFEPHAAELARRGLVTISVEYRTEGPITATLDAIDAINHTFAHTAELGIDRSRVIVAGGSAGGHLALSTLRGDLPHSDPANRPSAVVLFNPVVNTTGTYPDGWGRNQFEDDAQAEFYSPYHHIESGHPPVLITHGTADATVSFGNVADYVRRVRAVGGAATLVSYDGQGHSFFNRRDHYARHHYESLREADRFLSATGYLSGTPTIRPAPPQVIGNGGFERGLQRWSTDDGTTAVVVTSPTHAGRSALSIDARSAPGTVAQDITAGLRAHGPGEYLLSAWAAAVQGSSAEVTLTLRVEDADGGVHDQAIPSEVVPDHYTRVAGTRNVWWAGSLVNARLEVSVVSGQAYVDDVRIEFLPARVGWWRLSEGAGDVVADSSGFGLDGRLTGGTWISDGRPGHAVQFDGTDGRLDLPNIVNPADTEFAVRLWLRQDRTTTTRQVILRQSADSTRPWLYWDPATGSLATDLDGTPLTAAGPLPVGSWVQVTLVRTGDRLELVADGAVVASRRPAEVESSRASMIVGAQLDPAGSGQGWCGAVDEITFWDHVPPR